MAAEQNFQNHVRVDKAYMALMVLNLTLIVAAVRYGGFHFTVLNWILLGLAVAVTGATMTARIYALKNQNRIIRLEESIRLRSLQVDTAGLTMRQIIALRFASDGEVAALANRAVKENLLPKSVKAGIVQWRADHDRV